MFIDVIQNGEEWFDLRLGKITSSHFQSIVPGKSDSFSDTAKKYAQKVALEYVTKERDTSSDYMNGAMQRGIELEPVAIEKYEIETFTAVRNGGFNIEDSKEKILLGDSPDGNVGDYGCVEVKTVGQNAHWERLKKGGIDNKYKWQVHGHIWLGKKEWCDFISFCPEMPEHKQLYIFRVFRDEELIETMQSRLSLFKVEVAKNIELLIK